MFLNYGGKVPDTYPRKENLRAYLQKNVLHVSAGRFPEYKLSDFFQKI